MPPKLRKFDLLHDRNKGDWALKERGSHRATKRFATKSEATKGGVISKAVGPKGASVIIRTKSGTMEEERTYPRKADPKGSPG